MKERLGCSVDANLKKAYGAHVLNKYGHKRNKIGYELEKALKLYLTLEGDGSYRDDPDVREMLDTLVQDEPSHSHPKKRSRDSGMDLFAAEFIKEYKDRKQITKGELGHFASFLDGVCDPRAVQNRINYMVGRGVLEPIAPGVFEVKKEDYVGFR